jgi:hypothetical protein
MTPSNFLKEFSKYLPPKYDQTIKSRKDAPQGKEYISPSQIITKITPMALINHTCFVRPSNNASNISKSDEKGGIFVISNVACVDDVYVCNNN